VLPLDVVVDGVVVVVAVVVVVPWIAALMLFAWFELECDAAIAAPPRSGVRPPRRSFACRS
jgi:hypothetical protein